MKKRFIILLKKLIFVMTVMMITSSVTILAKEQGNVWDENAIVQVACEYLGEEASEILYQQNLYNIDEEVNAVFIKCKQGYMILGKCQKVYPVIEYGITSAACFLEEAELKLLEEYDKPEDIKLYYFGGMEYYCGVTYKGEVDYYKLGYDRQNIILRDELEVIAKDAQQIDYFTEEEWEQLSTGAASGKTVVKNPNQFENSFYGRLQRLVNGYDKPTYSLMKDFTYVFGTASSSQIRNQCVPTAATNLMKYWYQKNKTKYASLKSSTWKNTFKKLYKYMGTNNNGTYNRNMVNGYISYLKEVGIGFQTISRTTYATWNQMKQEIDKGYPFHLAIISKETGGYYGDHSVLALGYVLYTYNSGNQYTYSRYMAIQDGWDTGLRYVHVSNKVKCFEMIQLHLN